MSDQTRGIALDPAQVQDALDKINAVVQPVAGMIPGDAGAAVQRVAAVLASPDLAGVIVFLAGVPDHLWPQAAHTARSALASHPQLSQHAPQS